MNTVKTLLMASAVILAGVTLSDAAEAKTMMKTKETRKMERVIVKEVPVASSRRVGSVGGRPYPIIEGAMPHNSGGDYFTEDTNTYYASPVVDVRVHSTGKFNH